MYPKEIIDLHFINFLNLKNHFEIFNLEDAFSRHMSYVPHPNFINESLWLQGLYAKFYPFGRVGRPLSGGMGFINFNPLDEKFF